MMSIRKQISKFVRRLTEKKKSSQDRKRRRRMFIEQMEDRCVLSTVSAVSFPAFNSGTPLGIDSLRTDVRQMSDDGRFVVFTSQASNIIAGQVDDNNRTDVFRFDRQTGTTILVSHIGDGKTTGNLGAHHPSISGDGQRIVFASGSTNLVAGVTDSNLFESDIFLFSAATGSVTLVSRNSGNATTTAARGSSNPKISRDGSRIVFSTQSFNLISNVSDFNADQEDIYAYTIDTASMTLVSRAASSPTNTANSYSLSPDISDNGSRITFQSNATNLVPGTTDQNSSFDIFVYSFSSSTTTLVSRWSAFTTITASGSSFNQKISGDGNFVVFESLATDLVAGSSDSNNASDVFLFRIDTPQITMVSKRFGAITQTGNAASTNPSISVNGSKIAFESTATNLGPTASTGDKNVFLFDLPTNQNVIVSRSHTSSTTTANFRSVNAKISDDGQSVVYTSTSTDLQNSVVDNNSTEDVFVFNLGTGVNLLASRTGDGVVASKGANTAAISSDGAVIAFNTGSYLQSGIADGDGTTNDIYVGAIEALQFSVVGSPAFSSATAPVYREGNWTNHRQVSDDGRFIVFASEAGNLVLGQNDKNSASDIFLVDRLTSTTKLVSHTGNGLVTANGRSGRPMISGDGSKVIFSNSGTDLLPNLVDLNQISTDVFLYDVGTGTNSLVTKSSSNPQQTANRGSYPLDISRDGNRIVLASSASNLMPGIPDPLGLTNIYSADLTSGTVRLVSHIGNLTTAGNHNSEFARISADATKIVFSSSASNLAGSVTDNNSADDLFLHSIATRTNTLISRSQAGTIGNGESVTPAISDDANVVVFVTRATNLLPSVTDTNNASDIYVYNSVSGTLALVSHRGTGLIAGSGQSSAPDISGNGQRIVFQTLSNNLLDSVTDSNNTSDVFAYTVSTTSISLVSRSPSNATTTANGASDRPTISTDGSRICFSTLSTTIVPGISDTNGTSDVFLYDAPTGARRLVSRTVSGLSTGDGSSPLATISRNGRFAIFTSFATDLVANDRDATASLFHFDSNEAPTARPDQIVVGQNATESVIAAVLVNDSDPDGDAITILSYTQGANGVVDVLPGNSRLAYRPVTGYQGTDSFTYTIQDAGGLTSQTTVTVTVAANSLIVEPDSATFTTDLQSAVTTAAQATQATQVVVNVNNLNIAAVANAIRDIVATSPTSVVLNTNSGLYDGLSIAANPNVRVILDGLNGQITLRGASPALTVESGQVEIRNGLVLTNTTDAPTILVLGGHLILRVSIVEETTGGNRAAIEVRGTGTIDLGTSASGGNTFITRGAGLFIDNQTALHIPAFGNSFFVDAVAATETEIAIGISDAMDNAAFGYVDRQPPTSQIAGLAAITITSSIEVNWSGTDVGSGVSAYDVFVSINGGAYSAWLSNTSLQTSTYSGVSGTNYAFYSRATDHAGLRESPPAIADASTLVMAATLSATFDGLGNLTIADTDTAGKNNALTVNYVGNNLLITDEHEQFVVAPFGGTLSNGNKTLTIPWASVIGKLILNTANGDDSLSIDFAGGNPIPSGGVTFIGGNNTDELVITGGVQGTVTYNYTNATDGSIVMSNFGTVNYTGLEPISNRGAASDVIFNLPAGPNVVTLEDDGTTGNTLSRLSSSPNTFGLTNFANPTGSLTVNRGNATDDLTVSALPDFTASLTIGSTGSPFDLLSFVGAVTLASNMNLVAKAAGAVSLPNSTSDISTSGTGVVNITTAQSISFQAGASIGTVDGGINMIANGSGTTAGFFSGITLNGATLASTGNGDISITGKGGMAATGFGHIGVQLRVGSLVSSTGAGKVNIEGVGGTGLGDNVGVFVFNSGTTITSFAGDITINGQGGVGSNGSLNTGVHLGTQTSVRSTGNAKIHVVGTGGIGTDVNMGLRVEGFLTSVNGDVNLVGTATDPTGIFHHGLQLSFGSQITTTGTANLTVEGKSSGTNAVDVRVNGARLLLSGVLDTFIGDSIAVEDGSVINSGGQTVTLRQRTAGTAINLGSSTDVASNTLELSDAELDRITTASLQIGVLASSITISNPITRSAATNLTLQAGPNNNIEFSGAGTLDANGGNVTLTTIGNGAITSSTSTTVVKSSVLTLKGRLAPAFSGTGAIIVDSDVTFDATANYEVNLNGSGNYDQLVVSGSSRTTQLGGSALVITLDTIPAVGSRQVFRIVDSTGTAATVSGTFKVSGVTLNDGDTFTVGSTVFRINYNPSGAAGDVILTEADSAPPVIGSFDASGTFNENGAAVLLGANATLTDSDSLDFVGGVMTVSLIANSEASDRLLIRNQGTSAGQIGVAANQVTFAGNLIATFAGGSSGDAPLVINFGAGGSKVAAQALLRNLTFSSVSDSPSTLPRTVQVMLTDGDGGESLPVTKTINVNTAPTAVFSVVSVLESQTQFLFSDALDGSAEDIAAGLRYSYDFNGDGIWDLGDGTYSGSVVVLNGISGPLSLGNYLARGRVLDQHGAFNDYNVSFSVLDDDTTPPTIMITGALGTEKDGDFNRFNWTAQDASGISSVTVIVTRDSGNGPTEIFSSTSATPTGQFNFDALGLGTYVVTVTASDADSDLLGDSLNGMATRSVTIIDDDAVAPIITLAGSTGIDVSSLIQKFTWTIQDEDGFFVRTVSNIEVSITRDAGSGPQVIFHTTDLAQAFGNFNFDSFGAGIYEITASATDADNDWLGDRLTSSASRRVEVRSENGIIWVNRGDASDGVDAVFGTNAAAVRAVVDAAVDNWNRVVTDFGYGEGTNNFALTLSVNANEKNLGGISSLSNSYLDANGRPRQGAIGFGSGTDGKGEGWWIDQTPSDSSEFSSPSDAFEGNALLGSSAYRKRDLFSTVLHEIGHSLGINAYYLQEAASFGRIAFVNTGLPSDRPGESLYTVTGPNIRSLLAGGHIPTPRTPSSPENLYIDSTTGQIYDGANDLMNPSRDNGLRRLISNRNALILKDAYGFTISNPESLNTFYANLDKTTRTLTIHGGSGSNFYTTGGIGASNDVIRLSRTGNDLTVSIDLGNDHKYIVRSPGTDISAAFVTHFDASQIDSIVIIPDDGNDTIFLDGWAGSVLIDGQDGSDQIFVSLNGLSAGSVRIADSGSAGTDTLTVQGTDGPETITKVVGKVTWSGTSNQINYADMEQLTIDALGGNDTIVDPGENTILLGGDGDDIIFIDGTFGTGLIVDGGNGSDIYLIVDGNLAGPISITDSGSDGSDRVSVVGTLSNDLLVQTADGFELNGTRISFNSGLEEANFDGGGGQDQQVIEATPPVAALTITTPINTAPSFTSSNAYTVAEGILLAGTVTAVDVDLPPQQVTLRISGGADASAFTLSNAGVLSFRTPRDFENPTDADSNNVYRVDITAEDGAGGTRTHTINVRLTNVNEAPSALVLTQFSVSLPESYSTATSITLATIAISDDVLGSNSLYLSGEDVGFFEIFENSLRLKAGVVLNFETKSTYFLTVNVDDADVGSSPDASAPFVLTITNVNPSTPTDSDGSVSMIAEGLATGSLVGITAFATDPQGPNVTYSLTSNANGRFQIDAVTGVVTVSDGSLIDGPSAHTITVQASDGAGGMSVASFSIEVVNTVPTATIISNGPYTYGQTVSVSLTNSHDHSAADTLAGLHYAIAQTSDFSGVTYASGSVTTTTRDFNGLNAGIYTFFARIIDKNDGYNQYSIDVTINKANQVIAWSNPGGIAYGTALSSVQLNATVAGVVGGTVPGALVYNQPAGTVLNAGIHQSLIVTAAETSNYNFAMSTVYIDVAKVGLTVTANSVTRVYSALTPAFTASYSGFVNGDDPADLTGTLGFSPANASTLSPGSYPIVPSGLTSINYTVTYVSGTLTILPIGLVNGQLVIVGTDGRDVIHVTKGSDNTLRVSTLLNRANGDHGGSDGGLDGSSDEGADLFTYSLSAVTSIQILGLGGNDHLHVSKQVMVPVTIDGGGGDDSIWGGGGNDTITDMIGNNWIDVGGGNNVVTVGDGNNRISAGGSDGTPDGNNTIVAGNGNNKIVTSGGNDSITTGNGNNEVRSGAGNDVITTGSGRDLVDAGAGNDMVLTGDGDDSIQGGEGDDILIGGSGADLIQGGQGRDFLIGGIGADRLVGNQDEDILIAGWTAYDHNDIALSYLMQEWTSGKSHATRIANVTNGTGLTAGYRLVGDNGALQTVFNDNDIDTLTGSQGTDWFFANRIADNGGVLDIITDKAANELWNDTDFF